MLVKFIKKTRTGWVLRWNRGTDYKSVADLIDEALETGLTIGAARKRAFFDESIHLLKQADKEIIDVPTSITAMTPQ